MSLLVSYRPLARAPNFTSGSLLTFHTLEEGGGVPPAVPNLTPKGLFNGASRPAETMPGQLASAKASRELGGMKAPRGPVRE